MTFIAGLKYSRIRFVAITAVRQESVLAVSTG